MLSKLPQNFSNYSSPGSLVHFGKFVTTAGHGGRYIPCDGPERYKIAHFSFAGSWYIPFDGCERYNIFACCDKKLKRRILLWWKSYSSYINAWELVPVCIYSYQFIIMAYAFCFIPFPFLPCAKTQISYIILAIYRRTRRVWTKPRTRQDSRTVNQYYHTINYFKWCCSALPSSLLFSKFPCLYGLVPSYRIVNSLTAVVFNLTSFMH